MQAFLDLVILFAVARLLGEVCERARVPALIGEISAGILLGPLVLSLVRPSDPLTLLADLGIFFVVFEAGMEMTLRGVKRTIRESGAVVAMGSFGVPFVLGFLIGLTSGFDIRTSLFLGLTLSLTALPVSIRILTDLGWVNTNVGQTIITAGLLCDIAGFIVLATISRWAPLMGQFDFAVIIIVLLKVVFFFIVLLSVERILSLGERKLSKRIVAGSERLLIKGAGFSLPLLAVFAFALFSEFLGMHFVLGTFFGTVLVAEHLFPHREGEHIRHAISVISHGFLAPIFFAYIGLMTTTFEPSLAPLFLTLLTVAVIGKIVGGYLSARFVGFESLSATVIAVGMNGRGAMELIIALVGLQLAIISSGVFSVLVTLGLVTTLMTPIALRWLSRFPQSRDRTTAGHTEGG